MTHATDDPESVFGEKLGVFLMGIGLGYLVAVEAASGVETGYVGLLTVRLGVLVSTYFRRERN